MEENLMKSRIVLWLFALALAGSFALQAADVTGKWVAQVPGRDGETREQTFDLKQDGAVLTGTTGVMDEDLSIEDGKVEGDNISFAVTYPFGGGMKMLFKGAVSGDEIKMTREREGGSSRGPREFTAKRAK
jgi:hypothetical protein